MSTLGLSGLLVAFIACLISLACLGFARILHGQGKLARSDSFARDGRLAAIVCAVALTLCCGLLAFCFVSGDMSIDYVARNHSDASGNLAWLFKLSGLWAGRQGSLLLWAWLVSVFNAFVVLRTRKDAGPLDHGALAVAQFVLLAFLGVSLFVGGNMPFAATDPRYLDEVGALTGAASLWGMNALLEHWAMAVHPPALFLGYAGLTVPFAYGLAALAVNDDSARWVDRATGVLVFSWLMLSLGIGLGAVWAYVVLGWGGYWGWDPVENASLLPWLVGVALIHSFTVYRQRGVFKRWAVMCACLAFSFVLVGTFITRSGLVQSVHAFGGSSASAAPLLMLAAVPVLAGAVGLLVRHKSFGAAAAAGDDLDSLSSRETAYYMNNLILLAFAVLLAYLTLSSVLPAFLPFGGQALSAATYHAIARPLGIVYCLLMAMCPMLGWRKTEGSAFRKRALVPGLCALVLFVALMAHLFTHLLPSYQATLTAGGIAADALLAQGPSWYYNGLAVAGFAVSALLFFNAAFMVARAVRGAVASGSWRKRPAAIGGGIAHAAMGMVLAGLIGSSMYVTGAMGHLPYDEASDSVDRPLKVGNYELIYMGNSVEELPNGDDVVYTVHFDVEKDGSFVGSVSPAVQVVKSTMQQKLIADVLSSPAEDLFVVYHGTSSDGALSLDARVNPLIGLVWVGFALMMLGTALALFAKRDSKGGKHAEGE